MNQYLKGRSAAFDPETVRTLGARWMTLGAASTPARSIVTTKSEPHEKPSQSSLSIWPTGANGTVSVWLKAPSRPSQSAHS